MPGPTNAAPLSRPSRASSTASVDTTTSTASAHIHNPALLGATLAFGRSAPKQLASPIHIIPASNGALSAVAPVASVGIGGRRKITPSRSPSPSPCRPPDTSSNSEVVSEHDYTNMDVYKIPTLAPSSVPMPPMNRTASHQAAILAAMRHPPAAVTSSSQSRAISPRAVGLGPIQRRSTEREKRPVRLEKDAPTDSTPIAPTTSLVTLFEQTAAGRNDVKRPQPVVVKPANDLALQSPKPVRSGITSMFHLELAEKANEQSHSEKASQGTRRSPPSNLKRDQRSSNPDSAPFRTNRIARPPTAPSSTAISRQSSPRPLSHRTLTVPDETRRRMAVSPARIQNPSSRPIDIVPPKRAETAPSEAFSIPSSHSLKTVAAQFHQAYPRKMTPLTTGDDLANALVASSLASSHAPSPTRSDGPPVPTRRKKSHSSFHKLPFSRTPSPAKAGMLRTLRKHDEDSSDSEDEREDARDPYGHHKKKRLIRKHPNKHHEGDRKRWRDAITERERKRYEGVWAANKGLYCSFTYEEQNFFRQAPDHPWTKETTVAAGEQISNVVARELWNRSRLSANVLGMVWDLVDNDAIGRLHKEEFVVGMWLIDQRLKGRKLPVKVSDSVWGSVRTIHGLKVKK